MDWGKGSLVGYPAGERFLGKTTETLGRCGSVSHMSHTTVKPGFDLFRNKSAFVSLTYIV